MRRGIRRAGLLLALVLVGTFGLPVTHVASAATTVSCSVDAVQDALDAGGSYAFSQTCGLELTAPLTMTSGTVTLDGNGNLVDIVASPSVTSTQLFLVTAGSLSLEGLTLSGGTAQGTNGTDNTSNGDGGDGTAAQGGALYNLGTLTVDTTTFSGNYAGGGVGGGAGAGGNGVGAAAGNAGKAGKGAPAYGGSIYNGGTLTITSSSRGEALTAAPAAAASAATPAVSRPATEARAATVATPTAAPSTTSAP